MAGLPEAITRGRLYPDQPDVPSQTPMQTPIPPYLARWQFLTICVALGAACFFVVISLISACKVIRDRRIIKARIKERREKKLRQNAEGKSEPDRVRRQHVLAITEYKEEEVTQNGNVLRGRRTREEDKEDHEQEEGDVKVTRVTVHSTDTHTVIQSDKGNIPNGHVRALTESNPQHDSTLIKDNTDSDKQLEDTASDDRPSDGAFYNSDNDGAVHNGPSDGVGYHGPNDGAVYNRHNDGAVHNGPSDGVGYHGPNDGAVYNRHNDGAVHNGPSDGVGYVHNGPSDGVGYVHNGPSDGVGYVHNGPRDAPYYNGPNEGPGYNGAIEEPGYQGPNENGPVYTNLEGIVPDDDLEIVGPPIVDSHVTPAVSKCDETGSDGRNHTGSQDVAAPDVSDKLPELHGDLAAVGCGDGPDTCRDKPISAWNRVLPQRVARMSSLETEYVTPTRAHGHPRRHLLEYRHSYDAPTSMEPKNKKTTPPAFFTPRKTKSVQLMAQSPSPGNCEIGIDNLGFDQAAQ